MLLSSVMLTRDARRRLKRALLERYWMLFGSRNYGPRVSLASITEHWWRPYVPDQWYFVDLCSKCTAQTWYGLTSVLRQPQNKVELLYSTWSRLWGPVAVMILNVTEAGRSGRLITGASLTRVEALLDVDGFPFNGYFEIDFCICCNMTGWQASNLMSSDTHGQYKTRISWICGWRDRVRVCK